MKTKSLAQIHQQTLDILARLGQRRHTSTGAMEAVIQIHNRYMDNACRRFGVSAPHRLTVEEFNSGLPRSVYFTMPEAKSNFRTI